MYVVGFPSLFLFLGARELSAWMRLWSARRLARRRARRHTRP
jgi:hypothetical protein